MSVKNMPLFIGLLLALLVSTFSGTLSVSADESVSVITVRKYGKTPVPTSPAPATSAVAPPQRSALNSPPAATNAGYGYWSTNGNKIIDTYGNQLRITGINWSGAQSDTFLPHGLWARSYKELLHIIKDLGYNVIRMPYSNEMLHRSLVITAGAAGIDTFKNADLVGLTPLQAFDRIVDYAGQLGLRILLDRHTWSSTVIEPVVWYPLNTANWQADDKSWTDDWAFLAERYRYTTTIIGADLHNEPHAPDNNPTRICWGCVPSTQVATPTNPNDASLNKDWRLAAERAAKAIHEKNPHWLVFVEGIDTKEGDNYNWWGGQLMGVADAQVRTIVPNKVVYSPHEYGPSLYCQPWFSDPTFANMPARWDSMWGYIHKNNIAPVVVGELGTDLRDTPLSPRDGCTGNVPSDKKWYEVFSNYLTTTNISFIYWAINPNTELGGILTNNTTWATVVVTLQNALNPMLAPLAAPNWLIVGKTADNGAGTTNGSLSWALAKDRQFVSVLPTATMPINFLLDDGTRTITATAAFSQSYSLRTGLELKVGCANPVTINGLNITSSASGFKLEGSNVLEGLRVLNFPGNQLITQGQNNRLLCSSFQARS
jgi:endoglucanase